MKIIDTCAPTNKPFTFGDTKTGDVFEFRTGVYMRITHGDVILLTTGDKVPFSNNTCEVKLLPNATLVKNP